MDVGALGGLTKVLRPIATPTLRAATRLYAERKAGADPSISSTGLLDESLNDTISRLRGGDIEDAWWRHLLNAAAQSYVAPDWLKEPPVQQWLLSQEVHEGLQAIARAKIMATPLDQERAIREQLVEHYAVHTGDDPKLAPGAIDVVVAILAAGYIATIPPDQRALAGLVQEVHREVNRQGKPDSPTLAHNRMVERIHTGEAESALVRILTLRTFDFAQAAHDVQELWRRVCNEGDLVTTADASKRRIQYWAARLCSVNPDTLEYAQELRQGLQPGDTEEELAVVDAWILATGGDSDTAIRHLRRVDHPDARATLLTLLVRDRGDAAAIERFAAADPQTAPETFTDVGWRTWAACLAKLDRWHEAARGLRALAEKTESPALAAVEVAVNAALLIPQERRQMALIGPPLYAGIEPNINSVATEHHTRAAACSGYLEDRLSQIATEDLAEFVRHWRLWIRLMDPDLERRRDAHEEIRSEMAAGTNAVDLMPFAWAFGIDVDGQLLRAWLEQSERFGGLEDQEVVAEYLLNHYTLSPNDFAAYAEGRLDRLDQVMEKAQIRAMLFDALLQDGQVERARRVMSTMPDEIDIGARERMSLAIDAQEGRDPRSRLEAAYAATDSLLDLHNLIAYLQSIDDQTAAVPLTRALFDREPTPQNGLRAITSMLRADSPDYNSILTFLDEQPQLVHQNDQVVSANAWALFHMGRLAEAKVVNDALLDRRGREEDLALDVNIAVASGDWERLPAIVNRVWPQRHELSPGVLMTFARHAGNAERALELARLAVDKAPTDPFVLTGAYGLHFELGRDEDADPDWLGRALKESSTVDGPIWQTNLDQMVNEMLPRHREQQNRIERMVMNGELPMALAFGMSNTPLSRVLLDLPHRAVASRDGRRRAPVPIVSGAHNPVEVRPDWNVAFDLTSIMVLYHLELLDFVLQACGHVSIPGETMQSLYLERFEVRFHQPARVKSAKQVRRLVDNNRVKAIDPAVAPSDLTEEVGPELATLLATCRRDNGVVICGKPIYQAGSLMETLADTSPYDDVIFTAADLCIAISARGLTNRDQHEHAMDFLASQGQSPSAEIPSKLLDGPILVDRLAWSHLQNARLLEALADPQFDIQVHGNLLEETIALIEAGDTGDALVERIDGVRTVLRAGVESGTVSFLQFASSATDDGPGNRASVRGIEGLLAGVANCDAVCADDRYLNARAEATAATGESVPVVCVLDLLRYLRVENAITEREHWRAKHRLRQGGFILIPLEADELLEWLSDGGVENGKLTESAELRVIRQSVNWIDSLDLLSDAEGARFTAEHLMSCVRCLTTLWTDNSMPIERAAALCDWLWRNLVATTFVDRRSRGDEAAGSGRREVLAARLAVAALPRVTAPADRRSAHGLWLERSVFGAFGSTNSDFVSEVLGSSLSVIRIAHEPWQPFGRVFLDCLPESLREVAIAKDPAFAAEAGFASETVVNVGADVLAGALFRAAESAFEQNESTAVEDLSGGSITLRPGLGNKGEVVLLVERVDDNTARGPAAIPELALLAPDVEVRRNASRRVLDRLGPTAHVPITLSADLARRKATDDELLLIIGETGNGVNSFRHRFANKMTAGAGLDLADFVPQSQDYWERLCGPPTEGLDVESYFREQLVPYRKQLLQRGLVGGLEICCLGALRDDLLPGQWLGEFSDQAVWEALDSLKVQGNAIALLAALDVALYRLADERFERFAADAVGRLLENDLRLPEGHEVYRLFRVVCDLVMNSLCFVDGMAAEQGYRRRMCAWMHSGIICQTMVTNGPPVQVDALEEWCRGYLMFGGEVHRLADCRTEPLVLASQVGASSLRYEIAVRLVKLQGRHERAGREMPMAQEVFGAFSRLSSESAQPLVPVPGPCELHLAPEAPMPTDTAELLTTLWGAGASPRPLEFLAGVSQLFAIDKQNQERCRDAIATLGRDTDLQFSDALPSLYSASVVAASMRDTELAEAIANAITRLASTASEPGEVEWATRTLLQAAASHQDEPDWARWLGAKFVGLATVLPPTTMGGVAALLECLDAMEPVLPVNIWFHLGAKCVAKAGAQ